MLFTNTKKKFSKQFRICYMFEYEINILVFIVTGLIVNEYNNQHYTNEILKYLFF